MYSGVPSVTPGSVEEDVARLHVAVDDAAAVGVVQGVGDLPDEFRGGAEVRLRRRGQPCLQRRAGHEFHVDVADAVRLVGLVQLDDVGVPQPGERAGVAVEPAG
jgi:hypothetical protein